MTFSPDGRYLVSGGKATGRGAPAIHVRDARSGRLRRQLATGGSDVRSLVFSPDGSLLAAGGGDDRIWIWDVATWTVRCRLGARLPPTNQVCFIPNGSILVSCHWGDEDPNEDHPLLLWECATGQKIGELNGRSGAVGSFSLSPDGKTVALGGWDTTLRIWDLPGRKELHRLEDEGGAVIKAVAFAPDGATVAALSDDASIRFWDPVKGRLVSKRDGSFGQNLNFGSRADALAYSPRGGALAVTLGGTIGGLYPIVLADASTGRFLGQLVGHHLGIGGVAFSPDGSSLASASVDGTVRLWDIASGLEKKPVSGHAGWVETVAFSPDGKRLATGGDDHVVCIWDTATSREIVRFEGHSAEVRSVAFSPDGAMVASGALDNTVRLWDAVTGEARRVWKHEDGIDAVAFSRDRFALAAADRAGTIVVRDWSTGRELVRRTRRDEFGDGVSFNALAYAPRGGILASADRTGQISLWNSDGRQPSRTIRQDGVQGICFSPDGLLVAVGIDDPVRLYDPASGVVVRELRGNSDERRTPVYTSVAFAPSGKWLATGGSDGHVRVWDLTSGREVRVFAHRNAVTSVAVSPNGSLIASGAEDCLALLWEY